MLNLENIKEILALADDFHRLAKNAEEEADQLLTDSNKIKRLLFSNEHHQWLLAENMLLKKLAMLANIPVKRTDP